MRAWKCCWNSRHSCSVGYALPGTTGVAPAPALPGMTALELLTADAWAPASPPTPTP
ncbi:hypothetical protein [Saccharothrix saharensis]|uniref:hypothetical protein n=1 Tax=Saccharothrix saharensis TaxID=571190 RepID=UPI0014796F90|nr:hypothetical protein [Saccharothrix saharensis]